LNVYQKLQTARIALGEMKIKESGENKFAGYKYMELGDFLPQINKLCKEHGLCGLVSFGDVATLTIVNTDKPEETIVFTSPMSSADLKGCHAVQNLGAVQSYLRRYLWVTAFEIVEHDALDSVQGKEEKPKRQPSGLSPLDALKKELADYTADPAEQKVLLAQATKSKGDDGKEKWMDLDKLPTGYYTEKACGYALGKVRAYIDNQRKEQK